MNDQPVVVYIVYWEGSSAGKMFCCMVRDTWEGRLALFAFRSCVVLSTTEVRLRDLQFGGTTELSPSCWLPPTRMCFDVGVLKSSVFVTGKRLESGLHVIFTPEGVEAYCCKRSVGTR